MTPWYVLCEGYHDRAFLQGLLADHFGLREDRRDDDGKAIRDGQYGYRARSGRLVRVVPYHVHDGVRREGKRAIADHIDSRIRRYATDPADVIACTDEDDAASAADAEQRASQRLAGTAQLAATGPRLRHPSGMRLCAIAWACDDAASTALPTAQCLERLVVAAICAAHPTRAAQVARWLDSRDDAPTDASSRSKAFSWSHMAGWYAGYGCEAFLRQLWTDAAIAAALETRLRQSAAWDVLTELAT